MRLTFLDWVLLATASDERTAALNKAAKTRR